MEGLGARRTRRGPERDEVDVGPADPPYLRLNEPRQWPPAQPGLREAVTTWYDAVPFFLGPRLDAVIPRIPLPRSWRPRRPVTAAPANPVSATYGENAPKGWLQANPRVAERW